MSIDRNDRLRICTIAYVERVSELLGIPKEIQPKLVKILTEETRKVLDEHQLES